MENENIGANPGSTELLESHGSTPLKTGTTIGELIRRPELNYEMLEPIDKNRPVCSDGVKRTGKYQY